MHAHYRTFVSARDLVPHDRPNYGLWYVHLPKAWDGMRYGYRVDGAWDPKHGVRFNPYKFLLDPYGKGIDGSMELTPAAFSYECDVVDRKVIGSAYGAMSTVGLARPYAGVRGHRRSRYP